MEITLLKRSYENRIAKIPPYPPFSKGGEEFSF